MRKPIAITLAAVFGLITVLLVTKFEIPGPRYSEPTDYPSKIATALNQAIQSDPALNQSHLRVLWSWDWRWRYGAGLQVWGIENPSQREAIVQHLKLIKANLRVDRFIRIEFISGSPDRPPFGKARSQAFI